MDPIETQTFQASADLLHSVYHPAPSDIRLVHSPYRICPIGAHIDHQLGCVLGMPIDRGVSLVFAPNQDRRVRLRSLDFSEEVSFSLDDVPARKNGDWGNYPRVAASALGGEHPLSLGFDAVLGGSLPIGGLSSSAAVGIAYLMALADVNRLTLSHDDLIELDRYIENVYLGLNNGILDQSTILAGQRGGLLYIDCLTRKRRVITSLEDMHPFDILVVFSGVSQPLVATGYNQRVAECEDAARRLLEFAGETIPVRPKLRHVSRMAYESYRSSLPTSMRLRAAHFFSETERVSEGIAAWTSGDVVKFGDLMNASGRSSIDNYECGSPPLIALFEILCEAPGVFGTRFSGAGFRGACVAFVDPAHREEIEDRVRNRYIGRFPDYGKNLSIHTCRAGNGARIQEGAEGKAGT